MKAALVVLCAATSSTVAQPATLRNANPGEIASAFAAGPRPRVVHIWSSVCAPCVADLPKLLPALRARRAQLDVTFIALDEPAKAFDAANLLQKNGGVPGLSLRVTLSEAAMFSIHAVDPAWNGAIPSTYLVSAAGRVLLAQRGLTDLDALVSAADQIARDPKSTSTR